MNFTSPVVVVPLNELGQSLKENLKGLNALYSTADRVIARRAISITLATLKKLKIIKDPTPVEKFVLKFRKADSKNLVVYQKIAVLSAMIIGTTVFEIQNDKVFKAIEVAKVVLFEELVELGFDLLDIEGMITGATADIEAAIEA